MIDIFMRSRLVDGRDFSFFLLGNGTKCSKMNVNDIDGNKGV
ncbi:hypothetical protein B4113_4166 [Geobacillus sp. B4113_201601]|nr:hypothetical protein B4113_4166 [Geobacillus sp. B4113_201601]